MSNTDAVKKYFSHMRDKGFKNLSFLVHEDDAESVRAYINQLKNKRLKQMVLTPSDTLQTISALNLTDNEFAQIHHFGNKASVTSHIKYLEGRTRGYQENSNNYAVALRLKDIEDSINDGFNRSKAIDLAKDNYPIK